MRDTTLCYIEKNGKYLMLLRNKKEIDFNKGKWIGVGGKFEKGETAEQCLLREVKEETGYTLTSYKLRGVIEFISDEFEDEMMYLYTADGFEGEMIECNEGELRWIDKQKVMDLNLWEGDKLFLKLLCENAPEFRMLLRYEGQKLVEHRVEFV